jgi:hypothetical protein
MAHSGRMVPRQPSSPRRIRSARPPSRRALAVQAWSPVAAGFMVIVLGAGCLVATAIPPAQWVSGFGFVALAVVPFFVKYVVMAFGYLHFVQGQTRPTLYRRYLLLLGKVCLGEVAFLLIAGFLVGFSGNSMYSGLAFGGLIVLYALLSLTIVPPLTWMVLRQVLGPPGDHHRSARPSGVDDLRM